MTQAGDDALVYFDGGPSDGGLARCPGQLEGQTLRLDPTVLNPQWDGYELADPREYRDTYLGRALVCRLRG